MNSSGRRNLSNRNLNEDAVREQYLSAVEPFIQDAVIALDFSEIRKDYSEKQEWLCDIWDNSRKEKARGYWLLNIEAVDGEGKHFPLWLEPFSQVAEGYKSQAHVVKRGMQRVASHAAGRNPHQRSGQSLRSSSRLRRCLPSKFLGWMVGAWGLEPQTSTVSMWTFYYA